LANKLNAEALNSWHSANDRERALALQLRAFDANPLNAEIAGNLATYALQTNDMEAAKNYVHLALSLTRPPDKSGRTADWATLAAIYSMQGDTDRATQALYVTLGMAPDIGKRCYSAIYSTINVYGETLRIPTERMLRRIQDLDLSRAPACRLPIDWSAEPVNASFRKTSKLTINGMDPMRLNSTDRNFSTTFGRSLKSLKCSALGVSGDVRICGIRDNYLGDVDGHLIIESRGEDTIVGITIIDPEASTPSLVSPGQSERAVYDAYAAKFPIETGPGSVLRIMGTGRDSPFELRFWIKNHRIESIGSLVSRAIPRPNAGTIAEREAKQLEQDLAPERARREGQALELQQLQMPLTSPEVSKPVNASHQVGRRYIGQDGCMYEEDGTIVRGYKRKCDS